MEDCDVEISTGWRRCDTAKPFNLPGPIRHDLLDGAADTGAGARPPERRQGFSGKGCGQERRHRQRQQDGRELESYGPGAIPAASTTDTTAADSGGGARSEGSACP